MATTETDPFTLIYQRLWTALTEYTPLAQAIKGKLQFDQYPEPRGLDQIDQPGDCPKLVLLESGFDLRPFHFDTAACDMVLSHPLVIIGGDLKIIPVNKVKWYVTRAIHNAGMYLGMNKFVRNVTLRRGIDEMGTSREWPSGHKRMVSLLTIDVLATIDKAEVASGVYTIS